MMFWTKLEQVVVWAQAWVSDRRGGGGGVFGGSFQVIGKFVLTG